jgi:MFS transporter, DHA3 family, macrolide efflux protein
VSSPVSSPVSSITQSPLFRSPAGRTFLGLWLGQFVSGFGSNLTGFALGVWLYQTTGQATPLFLSALASTLPGLLLGPFAGVIVDRVPRKPLLLATDTLQALVTLALLLLLAAGQLQPWLMYLLLAVSSAAGTFQWPAQAATVSVLVPREELGRASGLTSMGESIVGLATPIVAGALVPIIGITGVMWLDLATFLVGAGILAFLNIPSPVASNEKRQVLWREALLGWHFIFERAGLLNLLLVFAGLNFLYGLSSNLITPLILARTGNDTAMLGLVLSAFGAGALAGSLAMTITGGPRPRIHGVFLGMVVSGLFGALLFGVVNSLPLWMLANFCAGFCLPVMNGSSQAIWQSKVLPTMQGRVFAVRRLIAQITMPVALAVAGPLTDRLFVPLMQGSVGNNLAWLLGPVAGRGYAALWVLCGVLVALNGLSGYLRKAARNVERDLPDAV